MAAAFRGGPRNLLRSALVGALGLIFAVLLAWLPTLLAHDEAGLASLDTLFGALLLALVALVPFFGGLALFEPRQFAGLPAALANTAVALLVSTLLSWPALWLLAWMTALVLMRDRWAEAPGSVALWAALTLLLALLLARVSAGLLRLAVPRRAVPAVRWVGLLLAIAALPMLVFLLTEAARAPQQSLAGELARILGWTPFGAPAAGLELALGADASAAAARFGLAAACALVLLLVWLLVFARSVTSIERPDPVGDARSGLEAFERFPARPREVISARALTYWRRDPRYRIALFALPFAPLLVVPAFWVAGVDWSILALIPLPLILLLLGWSVHNDVALDSTAIWMHVASGTRGRDDRAGRLAPVMLIGLPLVLVGSSLTVTFGGDWRSLPAIIGMNLAVLLVSSGVSSVFSALIPYPATRPGDSPFAQPAVAGAGAGISQTLSMLLTLLLSAPAVALSVLAMTEHTFVTNVVALGFGAVWGVLVLVLGILIGGGIFTRRGPELVAVTQIFD